LSPNVPTKPSGTVRLAATAVFGAALALLPAPSRAEEPEEAAIEDILADAASRFVPVRIELRKDEGEEPEGFAGGGELLRRRLPLRLGGIAWDGRRVLVADPCIPARFIQSVSVESGGRALGARFARFFLRARLAIVETDEPVPGVEPVEFAPAPEDPLEPLWAVSFTWDKPGWRMVADAAGSGLVRLSGTPGGELVFRETEPGSLLYYLDGTPVGFTASGRLALPGKGEVWAGAELRREKTVTVEALEAGAAELCSRLEELAFEVRLTFRREESSDPARTWIPRRFSLGRYGESDRDEAANEWHGTGFPVGGSRILVCADLGRDPLVRLERIEATVSGERRPCRFAGALKELGAILVEPEGWTPARSIDLAHAGRAGGVAPDELFLSARIDHSTGRRRVRIAHDRLAGWKECFGGRVRMDSYQEPKEGTAAFALDGRLLALALSDRLPPGENGNRGGFDGPFFVTAREILEALEAPDAFDPALRPLTRETEKRLVWLGAEYQKLTGELARVHSAEVPTKGGRIGLLVTHVYEGSPAARLGLRNSDILLRIEPDGIGRPVDLEGEQFDREGYDLDLLEVLGEIPEEFRAQALAEMPPPWPPQRNPLTELLTELGEGRRVRLVRLREGRSEELELVLELGPPDFESAPKLKSEELGLTVKDITYEVRHYYRLAPDEPGLVIAGVEPGGKAALGKLMPYSILRRANGKPLRTIADFGAILRDSGAGVLELTVEHFGKTRLVKIAR